MMVTRQNPYNLDHLFANWNRTLDQLAGSCDQRVVLNLQETHDAFIISATLPGVSQQALRVEVSELRLTLSAALQASDENRAMERHIDLPRAIHPTAMTIHFVDDILTVTLPKVKQEHCQ